MLFKILYKNKRKINFHILFLFSIVFLDSALASFDLDDLGFEGLRLENLLYPKAVAFKETIMIQTFLKGSNDENSHPLNLTPKEAPLHNEPEITFEVLKKRTQFLLDEAENESDKARVLEKKSKIQRFLNDFSIHRKCFYACYNTLVMQEKALHCLRKEMHFYDHQDEILEEKKETEDSIVMILGHLKRFCVIKAYELTQLFGEYDVNNVCCIASRFSDDLFKSNGITVDEYVKYKNTFDLRQSFVH